MQLVSLELSKLLTFCLITVNAPYSSKIDILKERFNKLIYGIHIDKKYGIWQPVKF